MLFTSAAFLFIFLPIGLVAYTLTPEKNRKWTLLALCFAFYVLANLKTPFAIPFFFLSVALFCIAGRYAAGKEGRTVCVAVVAVGLSLFAVLRMIYEYYDASFFYPLGAAIFLLSGISYVFDIYRGDAAPDDIALSLIYLTFFPTMIAGPVIKYKDFVKFYADRLHTLDRFSAGARRFALGLIERIAIAAVLIEAYQKIIQMSGTSLNIFLAVAAAFFIFLAISLAFAGWVDMSCGLSLMLGIDLPYDAKGAIFSHSIKGYFFGMFEGLIGWADDYIVSPISSYMSSTDEQIRRALTGALTFILTAVWIRTTLSAFLIAALIASVMFFADMLGGDTLLRKHRGMRPLGWLGMFAMVCLFWCAATFSSPSGMFEIFDSITFTDIGNSTYRVFISLSGGKYIFTAIVGLLLTVLTVFGGKLTAKLPASTRGTIDIAGSLLTVLLFGITLIYFLPGMSQYATEAFEYFVF